MSLTKLTTDLNVIQKLGDEPNDVDGLTAAQIKEKFDESGNAIKIYINNTLTEENDVLNAENVKKTGDQTIAGVKTFSSSPIVPTPTTDMQASTKKYVDDTSGISKSYVDDNFTTKEDITNTRKLSASGDFTGSWHGVTNPAYSEPGIAGLVDLHTEQLADIVTVASKFNILATNEDNHDNIISALVYIKSQGGGTLKFPAGIFKTSPISFQGYDNIIIEGVGPNSYWTIGTKIQFVGSSGIGFQFADTANPTTWSSKYCILKNLLVDGTNIDIGVNGQDGLELENIDIRYCKSHGIQLESSSWPITFINVRSEFNHGHGLFIKGPATTHLAFYRTEFSSNDLYGIYAEGGAGVQFDNVVLQHNKQGGLKIYKKYAIFGANGLLERFTFNNIHLEDNGQYISGDTNYKGNYAIVIDSDTLNSAANTKAVGIEFDNIVIGLSLGQQAFNINTVNGCKFSNYSGVTGEYIIGTYAYGVEFDTSTYAGGLPLPVIENQFVLGSNTLIDKTDTPGIYYRYGIFAKRGRTLMLMFYLPSIAAGQTTLMKTIMDVAGLSFQKAYPLFQKGSVLGLQIWTKDRTGVGSPVPTGTLIAQMMYGIQDYINDPSNLLGSPVVLDLATSNYKKMLYEPVTNKVADNHFVGVQMTASADYVAGADTGIVVYMLVEN